VCGFRVNFRSDVGQMDDNSLSRESNTEAALYYYRARYYDQNSGRLVSEDPVRFKAGINFYTYVFNDPINLIDPRGYAACCPSNEEPNIRKRINGVRNFLDQLDATGTIAITGTVSPLAETFCQGFKIKGHEDIKLPSQASTVFVDPSFKTSHPCLGKCAEAHEALHRAQCISMGSDRYGSLTEKKKEFPAYMVELGCLIKVLRDSGLNTIF
jgi:RHS repeat-associated protein